MPVEFRYLAWELKAIFRDSGTVLNCISFFIIMIFLFPLSLGSQIMDLTAVVPAIIWVGALLAVLIALDRFFIFDIEDGTLELLYLSRIPIESVIVVKIIAHWLTTGLPLTLLSPLLGLSLNVPITYSLWLLFGLAAGTPALSCLGALGASLTLGVRKGTVLTSLVVLPLYFPTLIFGTKLINSLMNNENPLTPFIFLLAISFFCLAAIPFICTRIIKTNWNYF